MTDFRVGDGGALLTGYIGDGSTVTVPSSVTKLGYAAFARMPVQTVTLSSVTEIRDAAFSGAISLKAVSTPTRLDYVGADAFSGTQQLSNPHGLDVSSGKLTWSEPTNKPRALTGYKAYVGSTPTTSTTRELSVGAIPADTTASLRVVATDASGDGVTSATLTYMRMAIPFAAVPTNTNIACKSIAVSADGNRIVAGDAAGTVRIYDVSSNGAWLSRATLTAANATFGISVAASAAGTTVAVSAGDSVRLYTETAGTWSKIADLSGNAGQNNAAVALSADGLTLALGCPTGDGRVYMYRLYSGQWSRIATLQGISSSAEASGCSVALSADGSILAVGAKDAQGRGAVRLYSGHLWNTKQSIFGESGSNELFGYSVSLSADGATLLVGAPCSGTLKAPGGAMEGYGTTSVWTLIGTTWTRGPTFYGEAGERFGTTTAINAAGNTIAISSTQRTRIYVKDLSDAWPLVATYKSSVLATGLNSTGDRLFVGSATSFTATSYRPVARETAPSYTSILAAKKVTNAVTADAAANLLAKDLQVNTPAAARHILARFASVLPAQSHASLACMLIAGNLLSESLNAAKEHVNAACTGQLGFTAGTYIDISSAYITPILSTMGTGNKDATYSPPKLFIYFPASTTFSHDATRTHVLYCLAPATTYTVGGRTVSYQRSSELQSLLLDLPNAANYIPPSGLVLAPASTQWRLTYIYRDVSSSTTTLEECALRWQQRVAVDPTNYGNYYTMAWISVDLLLTAATQTAGQAYAKLYTPIVRGLSRIAAFSDGGADDSLTLIPEGYFSDATDGTVTMPEIINITRTTAVKSIAAGAFGSNVRALILNGTRLTVANGSVTPAYTYYPPGTDVSSIIVPTTEEHELDVWLPADAPDVDWFNTKPARYGPLKYISEQIITPQGSFPARLVDPPLLAGTTPEYIKFLLTRESSTGFTENYFGAKRIYTTLPAFVKQNPQAVISIPFYHHTNIGVTMVKRAYTFTSADISANQIIYYGNASWVMDPTLRVRDMLVSTGTSGIVYVMPGAVALRPHMFGEWSTRIKEVRTYNQDTDTSQSPQAWQRTWGKFDPVTVGTIPAYAFKNCLNMTTQCFNASSTVGESAYEGCQSLQTIVLRSPTSLTLEANAFRGCTAATSLTIDCSGSVTVGANVFTGCAALQDITIRSSDTTTIDTTAFTGCTGIRNITVTKLQTMPFDFTQMPNLQNVTIEAASQLTYTSMANRTGLKTVTATGTPSTIQSNQFSGCSALETLSAMLAGMSSSALTGCTALKSVTLQFSENASASLSNLSGCTALTGITVSGGANLTLPTSFCSGCTALTTASLTSKTLVGTTTLFTGCSALTTLTVNVTNNTLNTPFGVSAVLPALVSLSIIGNVLVSGTIFWENSVLQHLRIQGTLSGTFPMPPLTIKTINVVTSGRTNIAAYSYINYAALTEFSLSPINRIGQGAFYNCSALRTVGMTDVSGIEDWAFMRSGVSGEVIIPTNTEYLGTGYFVGCPNLHTVTYTGDVRMFRDPTRISSNIWNDILYDKSTCEYDISGSITVTAGDISGFTLAYTHNGSSTTLTASQLFKQMNWAIFQERNAAFATVLEVLNEYFAQDCSAAWVNTSIFSFKTLGQECAGKYNQIPRLETFMGWNGSRFTVLDASANQFFSATPSKYTTYENRLYPAIANAYITVRQKDTDLFQAGPRTLKVQIPYKLPVSQCKMSFPQGSIATITGRNTVQSNPTNVLIKWGPLTKLLFDNNTVIDISGSVTTEFVDETSTVVDEGDVILWLATNINTVTGPNSVNIKFQNLTTSIEFLDYKQNATIDISSGVVLVHNSSMSRLVNSTVNISCAYLTLVNRAFADCSGGTIFNIRCAREPYVGTDIFLNSNTITVNSDQYLRNIPDVTMVDMSSKNLTDASSILWSQGINPAYTWNVEFGTYVPSQSKGYGSPVYAYIKFQELPTLRLRILLQKPEDWFWAYHNSGSYSSNDPDWGQEIRYIVPPPSATPWYGDGLYDKTGLKNNFAPSTLRFGGYTFTRTLPIENYDITTGVNPVVENGTNTYLRAVKTNDDNTKEAIYNNTQSGALLSSFLQALSAIAIAIAVALAGALAVFTGGASAGIAVGVIGAVGGAFLSQASGNAIATGSFEIGELTPMFWISMILDIATGVAGGVAGAAFKTASVSKATALDGVTWTGVSVQSRNLAKEMTEVVASRGPRPPPIPDPPVPLKQPTASIDINVPIGKAKPDLPGPTKPKLTSTPDGPPGPDGVPSGRKDTTLGGGEPADNIAIRTAEDNKINPPDDPVPNPEPIDTLGSRAITKRNPGTLQESLPNPNETVSLDPTTTNQYAGKNTRAEALQKQLDETTKPAVRNILKAQLQDALANPVYRSADQDVKNHIITELVDYLILTDDITAFSSTYELVKRARTKHSYLRPSTRVTLPQLAAHISERSINVKTYLDIFGNNTRIEMSLFDAFSLEAAAHIPPYVHPTSVRPSRDDNPYNKIYYITNWLTQGTNYEHPRYDRAVNGFPCQPAVSANPLHAQAGRIFSFGPSYLWKGLYLGNPTGIYYGQYELNDMWPSSKNDNCDIINVPNNNGFKAANSELYLGQRIVDYTLDTSIAEAPNLAYSGSSNVTIIIPSPVGIVPNNAFASTDSLDGFLPFTLASVVLHSGVTRIQSRAFYRTSLKSLTYPPNVIVDTQAFANTDLQSLTALGAVTTQYDPSGANWYNTSIVVSSQTEISAKDMGSRRGLSVYLKKFTSGEVRITRDTTAGTLLRSISNGANHWVNIPRATDFYIFNPASAMYSYFLVASGPVSGTMSDLPNPIHISSWFVEHSIEFTGTTMIVRYTPKFSGTVALKNVTLPLVYGMNITTGMIGGVAGTDQRGFDFVLSFNLSGATLKMESLQLTVGSTLASASPLENRSFDATQIAPFAFAGSTKLKHIDIAPTCTEIGEGAFRNCSNLHQDIVLPPGFRVLGAGAFAGTPLRSIQLPSTLTDIGEDAIPPTTIVIVTEAFPALSQLPATLRKVLVPSLDVLSACMAIIPDLPLRVDRPPLPPRDLTVEAQGYLTEITWDENPSPLVSPATRYSMTYRTADGTTVNVDNVKSPHYLTEEVRSVTVTAHNLTGGTGATV
jgi:hypothetical protein